MTKEEREDYLKYIENYTLNDLADEFNTQNFIIKDKDKFNEILLYYHFKEVDEIDQLQQENQSLKKENKILRENAEHNDKVVDKSNWENLKLKEHIEKYEHYCKTTGIEELMKENKKYKEVIDKAIKLIEDSYYSKNTTDIDSIIVSGNKLLQVRKILKEVEE